MPAPLSGDLRVRIIAAWQTGEHTWAELAERFGVGVATVNRLVGRFRATGSVAPTRQRYGAAPKLDATAVLVVESLLRERPDSTLAELVQALREETGLHVSEATMGRTVRFRLGWSRKKSPSSQPSASARR